MLPAALESFFAKALSPESDALIPLIMFHYRPDFKNLEGPLRVRGPESQDISKQRLTIVLVSLDNEAWSVVYFSRHEGTLGLKTAAFAAFFFARSCHGNGRQENVF